MTPKSFFLILIKIMGVYFLYRTYVSCNDALYIYSHSYYCTIEFTFVERLAVILPYIILFSVVILFFIIKPNSIIKLLRLDRDFEEEKFEFNIEKTSILKISIIVIGGIMFIENLSFFTL
jgi:hypothetical protein